MSNDNRIKTGYPHIDKPWLQFYDEKIISESDPQTNVTEYLKMKNQGRGNLIASSFYGKETSFNELFNNAEIAARVLNELGVKKGEVIMNLVPNIPASGEIWLGATQIGAISDFIDPRPDTMDINANAKKVLELIKYEQAKYIIALDKCYLGMLKPIERELKELGITTIITLSANDAMNLQGKISYLQDVIAYNNLRNAKITDASIQKLKSYQVVLEKMKAMKKESKAYEEAVKSSPLKIVKYEDLARACTHTFYEKNVDPEQATYIGHTSGTSGARPKPIILTNKNGISTLEQLIKGNVAFKPGEKALHVLPFFAPFGAYDNYLLNLVSGATNIDIPEFEISEFGYLLKKYHPNIIMATPAWISALPNYQYLKNEDLSCLTKIIYGGDSMTASDEENVNKWLRAHGSKAEVEKGYGMSEFCGCGTYAQKEYNKYESIGIPLPNTTIAIVDPNIEDKLVPLKFKEGENRLEGECAVSSDAVTEGIVHGDIIIPHYELDGKSYIRTRDIIEIDRNGILYHKDRKDRSFARVDGYKIKPHEIETEIEKNPHVKYVRITPYFDEARRGIMPICHVVLKEENLSLEDQIRIVEEIVYKQIIDNHDMSSRQIPAKFKIRASMPLSKNSKIDFNALAKEPIDGSEICVDVKETNLTVENISIYVKNNEKDMSRKLKK